MSNQVTLVGCGRRWARSAVCECQVVFNGQYVGDLLSVGEKFPFLSLPVGITIQAVDPVCLFGRLTTCTAESIAMAHSG